eukprot:1098498-Pleurochrysis_carterae.AAC.2
MGVHPVRVKPTAASGGHEWALVHVTSIKDAQARDDPTPMSIRGRQMGGHRARTRCARTMRCARRGRSASTRCRRAIAHAASAATPRSSRRRTG